MGCKEGRERERMKENIEREKNRRGKNWKGEKENEGRDGKGDKKRMKGRIGRE